MGVVRICRRPAGEANHYCWTALTSRRVTATQSNPAVIWWRNRHIGTTVSDNSTRERAKRGFTRAARLGPQAPQTESQRAANALAAELIGRPGRLKLLGSGTFGCPKSAPRFVSCDWVC